MKTMTIATVFVFIVLSASSVYAVEAHHPGVKFQDGSSQMESQQGMMMKNMDEMMKQMNVIQSTDDPEIRKKLMHEHMQTMHKNMKMMRGMGGNSMMGKGMAMNKDMNMGGGKDMPMNKEGMMQRHRMMEQRMDMMQMMMEQMMNRMMVEGGVKETAN